MKKLFAISALAVALLSLSTACEKESTWDTYKEWRETNDAFLSEQALLKNEDGTPFYSKLAPTWYPSSGVLIHYFNDRSLTEGNLTPLVTSTVSVKYKGWMCNDYAFDSSYTAVDSLFTFRPTETIVGWQIALTDMNVGDSARVVIPWAEGYGTESSGAILPFSTLVFDIKLVDVVAYETSN